MKYDTALEEKTSAPVEIYWEILRRREEQRVGRRFKCSIMTKFLESVRNLL